MIKYYSGDHSKCHHSRSYVEKEAMIPKQVEELKIILSKFSQNLPLYSHGLNPSSKIIFDPRIR